MVSMNDLRLEGQCGSCVLKESSTAKSKAEPALPKLVHRQGLPVAKAGHELTGSTRLPRINSKVIIGWILS